MKITRCINPIFSPCYFIAQSIIIWWYWIMWNSPIVILPFLCKYSAIKYRFSVQAVSVLILGLGPANERHRLSLAGANLESALYNIKSATVCPVIFMSMDTVLIFDHRMVCLSLYARLKFTSWIMYSLFRKWIMKSLLSCLVCGSPPSLASIVTVSKGFKCLVFLYKYRVAGEHDCLVY